MLASLPSGTAARIDVAALRRSLFAKRLPLTERYRNVYGPDLDIDRIADAILGARVGVMVYLADIAREQLMFDPHLGALAQKRMGKLSLTDWTITARTKGLSPEEKKEAKALAEMVTAKVERIRNFRQAIYDLGWGHFDARAALEIDWQWTGGKAARSPVALDWIHPRRLGYGPSRELRGIDASAPQGWFEPAGFALGDVPGKFISYLPRRFGDYPELEGLAPRSIYYSFFKRFAVRLRNVLTELFVLPWRTLEADKDSQVQKEDMDDAVETAEALGTQTVAGFPRGIKLNMLWPGSENQGQIMTATSEDVDSQMSRLWELTDAGGKAKPDAGGGQGGDQASYNQAQHNLVYQLDGVGISERIQRDLIDVIVLLNAGPDAVPLAPIFELRTAPPKDRAAEQKRYSQALLDRVPVALADYYEATGIRQPEDDEVVLVMAGGAAGTPGEIRILVPPGAKPPPGMVPPELPAAGATSAQSGATGEEPVDPGEDAAGAIAGLLGLERRGFGSIAAPDLGHGSPEVVILQGVRAGARETAAWAEQLAGAAEGLTDPGSILRALDSAAGSLPKAAFAEIVVRALVRGLMLGALDAAWEAEDSESKTAENINESHQMGSPSSGAGGNYSKNYSSPLLLDALGSVGKPTPGFVATPFKDAVDFFASKQILPRHEFDRLSAEAKRGAFTVAGLATQQMLETAHSELTNAIREGTDLRDFRKALDRRFVEAGWTPLKPSHVENIFRTNVLGAYAAGRDRQMSQPGVLALRPFGGSSA